MSVGTLYTKDTSKLLSIEKWQKIIDSIENLDLTVVDVERTEKHTVKKYNVEYGFFFKKTATVSETVFDYKISFNNNQYMFVAEDLSVEEIIHEIELNIRFP